MHRHYFQYLKVILFFVLFMCGQIARGQNTKSKTKLQNKPFMATPMPLPATAVNLPDTNKVFKLVLMMPFCSKAILENPASPKASLGNACREYFQGFMMAMDSLKRAKLKLDVKILDTQNDTNYFKELLKRQDVKDADFIIGPVVKEGQVIIASFNKQFKKFHLSPLLTFTKSKLDDPYIICANPDLDYYGDFILEYIKNCGETNANIVVVQGKEETDKIIGSRMIAIKESYPGFSVQTLDIGKYADLKKMYVLGRPNHFIFQTDNEYLINAAIRLLADSTQFGEVNVYGSKKWVDFKNINGELWRLTNVKLITPYYLNPLDPTTRSFIQHYRERYAIEPNEFAVSGYDQALYFLPFLPYNKGDFNSNPPTYPIKMIGNNYYIKPKTNSKGLQNARLNILGLDEFYELQEYSFSE